MGEVGRYCWDGQGGRTQIFGMDIPPYSSARMARGIEIPGGGSRDSFRPGFVVRKVHAPEDPVVAPVHDIDLPCPQGATTSDKRRAVAIAIPAGTVYQHIRHQVSSTSPYRLKPDTPGKGLE